MNGTSDASREAVFRDLPVPAALRTMILPAVASQLIVLIYNMADTFFVGQTNDPYMVAGTSLILPLFNITLCLSNLAGIGGGSLISQLLGRGEAEEGGTSESGNPVVRIGVSESQTAHNGAGGKQEILGMQYAN